MPVVTYKLYVVDPSTPHPLSSKSETNLSVGELLSEMQLVEYLSIFVVHERYVRIAVSFQL